MDSLTTVPTTTFDGHALAARARSLSAGHRHLRALKALSTFARGLVGMPTPRTEDERTTQLELALLLAVTAVPVCAAAERSRKDEVKTTREIIHACGTWLLKAFDAGGVRGTCYVEGDIYVPWPAPKAPTPPPPAVAAPVSSYRPGDIVVELAAHAATGTAQPSASVSPAPDPQSSASPTPAVGSRSTPAAAFGPTSAVTPDKSVWGGSPSRHPGADTPPLYEYELSAGWTPGSFVGTPALIGSDASPGDQPFSTSSASRIVAGPSGSAAAGTPDLVDGTSSTPGSLAISTPASTFDVGTGAAHSEITGDASPSTVMADRKASEGQVEGLRIDGFAI